MGRTGNSIFTAVCIGIAAAVPAWAMGRDDAPTPPRLSEAEREAWSATLEQGERVGIPPSELETAARLAASGISAPEATPLLAPALQAARQGLPPGPILAKLDEGALKNVGSAAIEAAARRRLESLERAHELLSGQELAGSTGAHRGLLVATGLALESGVTPDALANLLESGRDESPGRLKSVVEAGERLHLDGLDADVVRDLMVDCIERNLRRPEIARVVRFARERHAQGMGGPSIRAALWGEAQQFRGPAGMSPGRGSGPGGSGASAPGSRGAGPGPGGPGGRGGPPRGGPH